MNDRFDGRARLALKKFGLDDWKIVWKNYPSTLGLCDWVDKEISLANRIKKSSPVFNEVLLHEIAHALDSQERGFSRHDAAWRKKCVHVGCPPRRLIPTEI